MKRVLFEGRVSNCLGYVINKEDESMYYLLQGDNERCSFKYYGSKENFLHLLNDCYVHILIDEINLNSKYSWAEIDEVKFLNDNHLMETE